MSSLQPFNPTLITNNLTINELNQNLRSNGCNGCDLGLQKNFRAPVIFRGNPLSKRMIIGEAPGKEEDLDGIPFVGPAGQLLDKILLAAGWVPNQDFYITNVCKCRPVASTSSGKQNNTPTGEQRAACAPFIQHEISIIQPRIVLLLGLSAAKSVLNGQIGGRPMKELAGQLFLNLQYMNTIFYILYHPAAILHAGKRGEEYAAEIKTQMWEHVQNVKKADKEMLAINGGNK